MSQVVSIRLSDELAAELEKRGQSQGETIGVYIQEALKTLVDNQAAPAAAPTSEAAGSVEKLLRQIIYELVRTRSSLYQIAEKRIVPTEELQGVYSLAVKTAREYMAQLDHQITVASEN
jgi:hypothetical protein